MNTHSLFWHAASSGLAIFRCVRPPLIFCVLTGARSDRPLVSSHWRWEEIHEMFDIPHWEKTGETCSRRAVAQICVEGNYENTRSTSCARGSKGVLRRTRERAKARGQRQLNATRLAFGCFSSLSEYFACFLFSSGWVLRETEVNWQVHSIQSNSSSV